MIAGVIWDVDGTLVDTAELHFRAWQQLCSDLGLPLSRSDFAATFGRRNPEIIPQLFGNRFSPAEVAELGERKEELYRRAARAGVQPLPGVVRLLQEFRRHGRRQGIGSSAPRTNLDLILELTGLSPYFDAVVAMEDASRGKPDPEVFLVAARRLELAPHQCLVIEDAPAGVEAAKAAGMSCLAVACVGHHSRDTLRAAGADRVVGSLEEVDVGLWLDADRQ